MKDIQREKNAPELISACWNEQQFTEITTNTNCFWLNLKGAIKTKKEKPIVFLSFNRSLNGIE